MLEAVYMLFWLSALLILLGFLTNPYQESTANKVPFAHDLIGTCSYSPLVHSLSLVFHDY